MALCVNLICWWCHASFRICDHSFPFLRMLWTCCKRHRHFAGDFHPRYRFSSFPSSTFPLPSHSHHTPIMFPSQHFPDLYSLSYSQTLHVWYIYLHWTFGVFIFNNIYIYYMLMNLADIWICHNPSTFTPNGSNIHQFHIWYKNNIPKHLPQISIIFPCGTLW